MIKIIFCAAFSLLVCKTSLGQVTILNKTNTTPALDTTYPSLASAIAALNAITAISGPVTITLDPGNPETAPAGGYLININSISNTSASPITIFGSGNTITAFSPQTSGSLTDALFKIVGADYITIEDFVMQENSSNTTISFASNNMTEWGVSLLYASSTNGAQNNTIRNNTISLSNSYANTFGVYSNVRHTATNVITAAGISNGTTGPNSLNKVYGNAISNVNFGIVFIGSEIAANMDMGNDLGGSSITTGNSITNWGGKGAPSAYNGNLATFTASYFGIYMNCQKDDNISYNTIISSTLTGSAAAVRGIQKSYRTSTSSGTITPTGTFNTSIENNFITLSTNLPNNSQLDGILTENPSSGSSSLNINNNTIEGMSIQYSGSSNQMKGINNSSAVSILNISDNIIRGNTSTSTAGSFTAINQSGSIITSIDINNNQIGDSTTGGEAITYLHSPLGVSSALRAIYNSNTNGTLHVNIKSNNIEGFRQLGSLTTAPHYYIECSHSTSSNSIFDISNNTFTNLTANTSGDVYFIRGTGKMATNAGAQVNVTNNAIIDSFVKSKAAGNVYFYYTSGNSSTGNSMTGSGNNFSNITTTGSSAIYGWTNNEGATAAGPTKIISNNIFENWVSTGSSATTIFAIYCNYASGNSEISNNKISSIISQGHVNGIQSASTTADTLSIRGNVITGLNSSASTAAIVGLRFPALSAVTRVQNQIIGITSTSGSSVFGIQATTATASTAVFINYNTVYLNATSSTSTFSSAALYLPASTTSTSAKAFVRNNIMVNTSTPGASGKSVAFRRTGASLTNFDTTSNNNVFYTTSTPSSSTPLYYDGVNTRDSLGSYKAWLVANSFTNTENLSLSEYPNFVSTSPESINLFLSSTYNSAIYTSGNNLGILLAVDINQQPRMIISPYTTTIGAVDVSALFYPYNQLNWVNCNANISTGTCNMIPNPMFSMAPNPNLITPFNYLITPPWPGAEGHSAFWFGNVPNWTHISYTSPDVVTSGMVVSNPPFPSAINALGTPVMSAGIDAVKTYEPTFGGSSWYEGIAAKTQPICAGTKYMFSFFVNSRTNGTYTPISLNVVLTNCQDLTTVWDFPNAIVAPLVIQGNSQVILCQNPQADYYPWAQYVVTFTATHDFDMLVIYPEFLDPTGTGYRYIQILYPELVNVDNLINITNNGSGQTILTACGVLNATYEWLDNNNVVVGTTSQIIVGPGINPGSYSLNVCVPNVLNNPTLTNNCSTNVGCISGLTLETTVWTGVTSGDWNDVSNWNTGIVPNSYTANVYIPPSTPNSPEILYLTPTPNEIQVNNITLAQGATMINNGLLKIARSISADAASIDNYYTDPSNVRILVGSIEMNGSCAPQTIAGNVFVTNDVKNFTASNNVTISSRDAEGLDVHGELSFGTATSKTLTTGGNLTLVSTASTTANVAQIQATNFISGDVTVERHILTGLAGTEHAKTWQALATPTGANSTSQSVLDSWMEGQIPTPPVGYGTHIPDPRTNWSALGFDGPTANGFTSIKTFDDNNQAFASIANTGIDLYNKNGYFLFVRGDRYRTSVGALPNPTNMRSKGALFQPQTGYNPPDVTAPAWTGPPPGKYVMVGNPYASAIDLDHMYNISGYLSNLTGIFVVWDVSIPGTQGYGGYQYIDAASSPTPFTPTPGGTGNYYESTGTYPEIQSGQAFFVQANGNGSTGYIHFDEYAKSSNSRVVTRGVNKSECKRLWVGLYSSTGICDGTSITFGKEYSNEISTGDAGKLTNPGENFMIMKANGAKLAIESRQPINQSDTIFYAFDNLRQIKYQLKISPLYLKEEGLHATLVDNYLHRRVSLNLADSSFIDFTVDGNKASYENRFIIVFDRDVIASVKTDPIIADKNEQLTNKSFVVYPNPTENKTISIRFINQPLGIYKLQLINHAGQDVFNGNIKINDANGQTSVKPGRVATGSYQLVITSVDGRKFVQQVIIK